MDNHYTSIMINMHRSQLMGHVFNIHILGQNLFASCSDLIQAKKDDFHSIDTRQEEDDDQIKEKKEGTIYGIKDTLINIYRVNTFGLQSDQNKDEKNFFVLINNTLNTF